MPLLHIGHDGLVDVPVYDIGDIAGEGGDEAWPAFRV